MKKSNRILAALTLGLLTGGAYAGPPPLFSPAGVVSDAQKTSAVCQVTNLDPKEALAINVQMVDADGTVLVPLASLTVAPFQTDYSSVSFTPAAGQVNHPRCIFLPVPPAGGAKGTPPAEPGAGVAAGGLPQDGPEGKPRPRDRFRAGLQILGNNGESLLVYLGML
jgi:hypothetical protein